MVYLHITKEVQQIVSLIPFTTTTVRVYMGSQEAVNSLLQWYRSRMIHPTLWRSKLDEDLKEAGFLFSTLELDAMLALACEQQGVWNPFHPQHLREPVRMVIRKE